MDAADRLITRVNWEKKEMHHLEVESYVLFGGQN